MSYFRPNIIAMSGYLPGEQPRSEKIIKLNTNENPYQCSPKVKAAIGRVVQQGLQKYPDPLATAFRIRAGEVLGFDPEWILAGNGSDEVLTMITRAFVDSGDSIRFANPSYILYKTLAEIQGARCDKVNFQRDWSLGDDFARPAERLKLAFLTNPNSPSGTMLPPARVAELAAALPCPLVVDEAYVDFADTNCLALVKENKKILVTRTLSKSYALCGLRFGFVVAQPQIIGQLRKVKDSYNCDALSIAGATAAIDDQAWLAANRAPILATRERMIAALRDLGFQVVDSQANYAWCVHPTRQVEPIYQQLKAAGVLVRYLNYPGWGDGLRISVGTDEQADACLALLKTVL
ncbi:MAG TPA: histidinol-phosphate transaminase [Lacipirellulaceae bacterium]|jgi:histidinol-phosphate aminotransferase